MYYQNGMMNMGWGMMLYGWAFGTLTLIILVLLIIYLIQIITGRNDKD